jgi:DHA2 family multidrug resistance protein
VRWVLAFGAILIGIACLMGTGLTKDWATDDFLPSQILQAIGQSFALTAFVVLAVKSMNPADVLTVGTLFQTTRLFGGEIGTAFMQTFVRVREQVHSNLIGLHVDSLAHETADRLAAYRNAVGAHSGDAALAAERATSLLASATAKQAAVLSYVDKFLAVAVGAYVCLFFTVMLRRRRNEGPRAWPSGSLYETGTACEPLIASRRTARSFRRRSGPSPRSSRPSLTAPMRSFSSASRKT